MRKGRNQFKRKLFVVLLMSVTMLAGIMTTGCNGGKGQKTTDEMEVTSSSEIASSDSGETTSSELESNTSEDVTTTESTTTTVSPTTKEAPTTTQEPTTTEAPTTVVTEPTEVDREGKVIVVDAGHQAKGNSEKEPVGPGSETLKAKVSSGTRGCSTGIYEYVLNLDIALMLQAELESRGYTVIMTRTTHDVNMSNIERATIANEANADAFIRIHANGSENSSVQGAETLCQTKNNPWNGSLYEESKALAGYVLDEMCAATGAKKRKIWETDTMSGINWCQVPVTIVEMGYMSNAEEDELLSTQEYREKMVQGIANGIDKYIESKN